MPNGKIQHLVAELTKGSITRREFLSRASGLGIASGTALFLANAAGVSATNGYRNGFAVYQSNDGTPAASPESDAPGVPAENTEDQQRGEGGELRIIQWQAPTLMSPHISQGTKDFLAAQLVLEPLIHYTSEATMVPNLLAEMPSVENGQLAEDLTWVELRLLPEVLWSDGEPFTADDVAFTIDWVLDVDNNAVTFSSYESIESYEVIDELTIRVNFESSNPFWFDPFAGTSTGFVYPRHVLEIEGSHDDFVLRPVGTGPYTVESFTPNDEAVYVANENYREPNKPYFDRVLLKGGGDAAAAARAVLQTGEFDYAWNLALEPDVIEPMESDGAPGEILAEQGISVTVEKIHFNFSDPDTEVDGQRSEMNTPHPYLSDDAVRRAIVLAVNRQLMVDNFYGYGQELAVNVLYGDDAVISTSTSYEHDPDEAVRILEDAGWELNDDGVRSKDGVALDIVFATSVNPVRQKIQSVVKANLEEIGFRVQLEQIDAGIYFDTSPGNDDNIYKFYWDFSLYQSIPNNPRSIVYMKLWYAGPDNSNISQASNDWQGGNLSRWINEDYDAAYEAAMVETDPERLTELFVEMNDLVIHNDVVLPIVIANNPRAINKRLNRTNISPAAFSYDYWNIANWNWEPES